MATNYPYVSAQGALVKAFDQFRKAFPAVLDAEALKKFGIAPANESYVVNTFRFLGLIDDEGKRVGTATDFFYGDDAKFSAGLDEVVAKAYQPLISDHGESVWGESKETLTTWFRVTDKTSEVVGGRQAQTFLTLAALAGHGELKRPSAKPNGATPANKPTKSDRAGAKRPAAGKAATDQGSGSIQFPVDPASTVGLTVRVEVNLPADGSPDTYDAIFGSIRKHLIDRG